MGLLEKTAVTAITTDRRIKKRQRSNYGNNG